MKQKFIKNTKYEILGQNGWENFDGLVITEDNDIVVLKIKTEDDFWIECTENHLLYDENNNSIESSKLKIGNFIQTINGKKQIKEIKRRTVNKVFDIFNSDSHKIFTNGIKNHQCDEFAFVPKNQAAEFWAANYPTLSSSKESKVVIISTPNGMFNLFHQMYEKARTNAEWEKYKDAIKKGKKEHHEEVEGDKNEFVKAKYDWKVVPGRDMEWAEVQRKNLGDQKFNQEFAVEFIGSTNTIINPNTLTRLFAEVKGSPESIELNGRLRIYEQPRPNATYILGVDPAKGTGKHDSTIQILRIDSIKPLQMEQVGVFQDNKTDPLDFSQIINRLSYFYNNAMIFVENNGEGAPVIHHLWWTFENQNLYTKSQKTDQMGIRATAQTKSKAVMLMKRFLENKNLKLNDEQTVFQLASFIEDDSGKFAGKDLPDDLVSSLYWGCFAMELDIFDDNVQIINNINESDEDIWGVLSDVLDTHDEMDW